MRRKRSRVYCSGCAWLFYCEATGEEPVCLATVRYVDGPIRPRIDASGIVDAASRNRRNDCQYRTSVSVPAWRLKRYLLERINDGSARRIRQKKLRDYPLEAENQRKDWLFKDVNDFEDTEVDESQEATEDFEAGEAEFEDDDGARDKEGSE